MEHYNTLQQLHGFDITMFLKYAIVCLVVIVFAVKKLLFD